MVTSRDLAWAFLCVRLGKLSMHYMYHSITSLWGLGWTRSVDLWFFEGCWLPCVVKSDGLSDQRSPSALRRTRMCFGEPRTRDHGQFRYACSRESFMCRSKTHLASWLAKWLADVWDLDRFRQSTAATGLDLDGFCSLFRWAECWNGTPLWRVVTCTLKILPCVVKGRTIAARFCLH